MPRKVNFRKGFEQKLLAVVDMFNQQRSASTRLTVHPEGTRRWSVLGGAPHDSTTPEWYEIVYTSLNLFTEEAIMPGECLVSFNIRCNGRYLHMDMYNAILSVQRKLLDE